VERKGASKKERRLEEVGKRANTMTDGNSVSHFSHDDNPHRMKAVPSRNGPLDGHCPKRG